MTCSLCSTPVSGYVNIGGDGSFSFFARSQVPQFSQYPLSRLLRLETIAQHTHNLQLAVSRRMALHSLPPTPPWVSWLNNFLAPFLTSRVGCSSVSRDKEPRCPCFLPQQPKREGTK